MNFTGVAWGSTDERAMRRLKSDVHANVGSIDRVICIVIGGAVLSLFFLLQGPAKWFALLGVVPVATGLMRWRARASTVAHAGTISSSETSVVRRLRR